LISLARRRAFLIQNNFLLHHCHILLTPDSRKTTKIHINQWFAGGRKLFNPARSVSLSRLRVKRFFYIFLSGPSPEPSSIKKLLYPKMLRPRPPLPRRKRGVIALRRQQILRATRLDPKPYKLP